MFAKAHEVFATPEGGVQRAHSNEALATQAFCRSLDVKGGDPLEDYMRARGVVVSALSAAGSRPRGWRNQDATRVPSDDQPVGARVSDACPCIP